MEMQTVKYIDHSINIEERAIMIGNLLYTESDCVIGLVEGKQSVWTVKPGKWSEKIRKAWGL